MAISGEKFLEVTRARVFRITGHALKRIRERAGRPIGREEAAEAFLEARQVRPEDMYKLGYRPAYGRRKQRGENSWYFRLKLAGRELIAVLTDEGEGEEFCWVTTYGRNAQTNQLQQVEYDNLALAG